MKESRQLFLVGGFLVLCVVVLALFVNHKLETENCKCNQDAECVCVECKCENCTCENCPHKEN